MSLNWMLPGSLEVSRVSMQANGGRVGWNRGRNYEAGLGVKFVSHSNRFQDVPRMEQGGGRMAEPPILCCGVSILRFSRGEGGWFFIPFGLLPQSGQPQSSCCECECVGVYVHTHIDAHNFFLVGEGEKREAEQVI